MYIFHLPIVTPCRSPLNIVHAGLDIVRHEFELKDGSSVVHISTDTAKMIENIFSASESAIANVNDLLHYEHLDSGNHSSPILLVVLVWVNGNKDRSLSYALGTFKLELSWQPVGQLMGKNLEWVRITCYCEAFQKMFFKSLLIFD